MKKGFTKAWRREIESDIWKMPYLYHRVFFWLRQKVKHETELFPTKNKLGIWLCSGQLITSMELIAEGVSFMEYGVIRKPNRKTIKVILEWLQSNSMIALFSNSFGTTVFILNWYTYQTHLIEKVTPRTQTRGQTRKRRADTIKEVVEVKEEVKNKKHIYGEFKNVLLTDNEYEKLQSRFNSRCAEHIERLSEGKARKGYKYTSDYLAILKWEKKEDKSDIRSYLNEKQ